MIGFEEISVSLRHAIECRPIVKGDAKLALGIALEPLRVLLDDRMGLVDGGGRDPDAGDETFRAHFLREFVEFVLPCSPARPIAGHHLETIVDLNRATAGRFFKTCESIQGAADVLGLHALAELDTTSSSRPAVA